MNELFDARGGIWLVAAGAASAAITWIAIRYARRHQLLDLPGQRRSHAAPTPRGGGIGIAVVALLVAALALHGTSAGTHLGLRTAVAISLVAAVGWIDDHVGLRAIWRFAAHCLAAL